MNEVQLQFDLDQAYGFGEVQVSVTPMSVDVWNSDGEWIESFDSTIEMEYAYGLS